MGVGGTESHVWVLGSMGWMPARDQQTACVLVEHAGELLLLDAGTGVANLDRVADVVARHDQVSVLLSHYHLDHIVGIMYLNRFLADKRLDIYGPGRPVYSRTTASYVADVLQRDVYSLGPDCFAREVRCRDYGGKSFRVGRVRVGVRPQVHSSPSFELRLDDVLVYATDTNFDATAWHAVAPAQLLLHECWQVRADDPRHTSVEALVTGRLHESFGQVVLIHQNPGWSDDERREVERVATAHGIDVAYDGMHVDCSERRA